MSTELFNLVLGFLTSTLGFMNSNMETLAQVTIIAPLWPIWMSL